MSKVTTINKDVKNIRKQMDKQAMWQEMQDFKTQQILNMIERLNNKADQNDVQNSRFETESVGGIGSTLGLGLGNLGGGIGGGLGGSLLGIGGNNGGQSTNPRMVMLLR